jgi:hypothetical protein
MVSALGEGCGRLYCTRSELIGRMRRSAVQGRRHRIVRIAITDSSQKIFYRTQRMGMELVSSPCNIKNIYREQCCCCCQSPVAPCNALSSNDCLRERNRWQICVLSSGAYMEAGLPVWSISKCGIRHAACEQPQRLQCHIAID